MKDHPFFLTIASCALIGLLGPGVARAFDPAPLCAYRATDAEGLEPLPAEFTIPGLMCELGDFAEPEAEPEAQPEAELGLEDARRALARSRELAAAGRHGEAALHIRRVALALPELADRVALEEAGYRLAAGPDEQTCEAFERARQSPQRTVATRAHIGWVRCLLAIGDRDGIEELDALRRRYPELPHDNELRLLLGAAHEGWGEESDAARLYRRVDLMSPGRAAAIEARARLARLREGGLRVRALTPVQRVERAERLVRSGPMELARAEIAALREEALSENLARQVARSAARIARVEGRWEDASRLLREAQGLPDLEPEDRAAMDHRIRDLGRAAASREREVVERRIRSLRGGRRLSATPTARLFSILRLSSRAGLADIVNDVLDELRDHDRLPPGLAFDAAIQGAGTGDDERVAALFERAMRHPNYAVSARYHRARALERLGRTSEARAEYLAVVEADSRRLPYYAMWSRQRLRSMLSTLTPRPLVAMGPASCDERGPFSAMPMSAKGGRVSPQPAAPELCSTVPPPNPFVGQGEEAPRPERPDGLAEVQAVADGADLEGEPIDVSLSVEEIERLLEPLAREYGDAFPWLRRAHLLVQLGELEAADDEIHEVFTAWRDARGRGSLRAGLAGVLRGAAPPRHRVSGATWRARRSFPSAPREVLAQISAALGDHGLAIRFSSGFGVAGPHPRAYEELVEAAAARHGVQPELLFAVMRVESVYNPRIISYAGAIGLMQIMPRTGRNIAHRLGRESFTIDQLLEPEVNIELAAWYLASLIERFEGRIPLAIASYNGGPHNVRRWMRAHSPDIPVDAFLERIPFEQTHRYVRRVMTHYEAYRAQRGGVLPQQDTHLPDLDPDRVAF